MYGFFGQTFSWRICKERGGGDNEETAHVIEDGPFVRAFNEEATELVYHPAFWYACRLIGYYYIQKKMG